MLDMQNDHAHTVPALQIVTALTIESRHQHSHCTCHAPPTSCRSAVSTNLNRENVTL